MYKKYKKDLPYSYLTGIYPVLELIDNRPDLVRTILIDDKYDRKEELIRQVEGLGLAYELAPKAIRRISPREDSYLVAVFDKENRSLAEANHIVLDRPSNMGNLGTIIRTMLGLGYQDLAITGQTCDHFHPKVVRASMGAFFKVRIQTYPDLEGYIQAHPANDPYLFMLGEESLLDVKEAGRHSLVFGNEGEGLDESARAYGRPVMIPQSQNIDSLNLPISAAIAMFYFSQII